MAYVQSSDASMDRLRLSLILGHDLRLRSKENGCCKLWSAGLTSRGIGKAVRLCQCMILRVTSSETSNPRREFPYDVILYAAPTSRSWK